MAKKKKILLLSDDLRMTSGIATVSKEFVFGTMDKFHWVQLSSRALLTFAHLRTFSGTVHVAAIRIIHPLR